MHRLPLFLLALAATVTLSAQPSFEAPPPSTAPVQDAGRRHDEYLQRVNEVMDWRAGRIDITQPEKHLDMAAIAVLLTRG